ncbi:hypothetical protein HDV01_001532 [Terramyces sp. JEL0728]|nr:hypothetical protein HDV01_001532 [Terramyces sp. JEL0728]
MQFLSLIVLSVSAQTITNKLNPFESQLWANLSTEAKTISDSACAGEIVAGFKAADGVYAAKGLSDEFVASLKAVQVIAGDVPEAEKFRSDFGNMTALVIKSLADWEAYLASQTTTSATPTATYTAAAVPTDAKNQTYGAALAPNYSQGPQVYGVLSHASNLKVCAGLITAVGIAATLVRDLENKVEAICIKLKGYLDGGKFTEKEITALQDELHAIDEKWKDGAIKEDDGSIAPGQAEFGDLLNEAHEMVSNCLEQLPE